MIINIKIIINNKNDIHYRSIDRITAKLVKHLKKKISITLDIR